MTDNERLATEFMGWTKKDPEWWKMWNPFTRIQDAWMLEERVSQLRKKTAYALALRQIVKCSTDWAVIHATPEQRCAAILKLMEDE